MVRAQTFREPVRTIGRREVGPTTVAFPPDDGRLPNRALFSFITAPTGAIPGTRAKFRFVNPKGSGVLVHFTNAWFVCTVRSLRYLFYLPTSTANLASILTANIVARQRPGYSSVLRVSSTTGVQDGGSPLFRYRIEGNVMEKIPLDIYLYDDTSFEFMMDEDGVAGDVDVFQYNVFWEEEPRAEVLR